MNLNFRDFVERVKELTDIVEVIRQRISLDRNHKALCPFHLEKTPSFSVNPSGKFFHCFGCGIGGDVFKFLELYENRTFMNVLSELANDVGLSLSSLTSEDENRIREDRQLEDILAETARFYHQTLTSEAKDYLTKVRGFTEETISRFQIGYAIGGLREYLIHKCRFPLDSCLKARVLRRRDGGVTTDYFYHRIIFPNIKRGRVVHLSGRSLDGGQPKYLHLAGEIRYLYNEDALSNREIYITEGIPDCISLVQAGYPAAAVLGSSNFKLEYLPRFSRCETICVSMGTKLGRKGR